MKTLNVLEKCFTILLYILYIYFFFNLGAHPMAYVPACVFSRVRLCNPMDYSPPGSSVHGIFQARILEWVAISSCRGSFQPRNQTHVSTSCTGRRVPWHQFSSVAQSCPTLCDPMNRSTPGPQFPEYQTLAPALEGRALTTGPPEKSQFHYSKCYGEHVGSGVLVHISEDFPE